MLRMDGHTAEEIAEDFGCSLRTVFNKLKLIRMKWDREAYADDRRGADLRARVSPARSRSAARPVAICAGLTRPL